MAVYTQVSGEALAALLTRYEGAGSLVSAKGIAEGVENSNYLVSTTTSRFILTLYEKRVDAGDLPFFLALIDHCADRGLSVPRALRDREGVQIQTVAGRPACLIEFLNGLSPTTPTPAQTRSTGEALGRLHAALADFPLQRRNTLGPAGWHDLAVRCGAGLDSIQPGLRARIAGELLTLSAIWPDHLERAAIHADLFPDNVLMLGDAVTGLIDFYFACTDLRAWDYAVTLVAWCFNGPDDRFERDRAAALAAGYAAAFGLNEAERIALPTLARGACLRFLLTRAWDWVNTPAGALVVRKDPLAFLRRLEFCAQATPEALLGA